MKRIISLILCLLLLLPAVLTAAAEEYKADNPGSITFVDFNVDGLPIPSFLSSSKKSPVKAATMISRFIKDCGADIAVMQENFNVYPIYERTLSGYNLTQYTGGAGVGDGLAVASKFSLGNVEHQAWKSACGILTSGNDRLTPKGFMKATAELSEGVYLDIYTLHCDAFEDEGSLQAKRDQFHQLADYIDKNSQGHAVIIAGDFNSNYSIVLGEELREVFVNNGFKDTWIEACNGGDYNVNYAQWCEKLGVSSYWGYFDCLDKVYFRSSEKLKLSVLNHEYKFVDMINEKNEKVRASDHAAIVTELSYEITDFPQQAEALKPEKTITSISRFFAFIKAFFRDLALVISELPALISGEIKFDWIK